MSERLGARRGLAEALQFLGAAEFVAAANSSSAVSGDVRSIMERGLALWEALDDKTGMSWELYLLASVAETEGDLPRARTRREQSIALRRAIGDPFLLGYSLRREAEIALRQQDYAGAKSSFREALEVLMNSGGKAGIAASLAGFAGLLLAQGQLNGAVRLLGAVDQLLQVLAWRLPPADNKAHEQNLASARAQLGDEGFQTAWEEGHALNMEQAIRYALGQDAAK